jgi:hypothetical protein
MTPNCSTSVRCSTASGLVEGIAASTTACEVGGANAARAFLRENGVSGDALRTVWDAIALHTTPGIRETEGARSRSGYGGRGVRRPRREAARVRALELLRDHPRLQAQHLILLQPRPNANDRAWRSGARGPFSTPACLTVVSAPCLSNEPRTHQGCELPATSTRLLLARTVRRCSKTPTWCRRCSTSTASGCPSASCTPSAAPRTALRGHRGRHARGRTRRSCRRSVSARRCSCASEVNVLTPTLPGRLAWLADDVDRFRHYADERLDTVLSYKRRDRLEEAIQPRRET